MNIYERGVFLFVFLTIFIFTFVLILSFFFFLMNRCIPPIISELLYSTEKRWNGRLSSFGLRSISRFSCELPSFYYHIPAVIPIASSALFSHHQTVSEFYISIYGLSKWPQRTDEMYPNILARPIILIGM